MTVPLNVAAVPAGTCAGALSCTAVGRGAPALLSRSASTAAVRRPSCCVTAAVTLTPVAPAGQSTVVDSAAGSSEVAAVRDRLQAGASTA